MGINTFYKQFQNVASILKTLSRQPQSRAVLERKVFKLMSHAAFEGTFTSLVKAGYIKKIDSFHRSPFMVTEQGTQLLTVVEAFLPVAKAGAEKYEKRKQFHVNSSGGGAFGE